MSFKIGAILFLVILSSFTSADYILDGVGGDEFVGYLFSPVFGPFKIALARKARRQAILHALPLPFAPPPPAPKPAISPMSDSFFEISDKEDPIA